MATSTTKGRSSNRYGTWAGFSFGGSPSSYGSNSNGTSKRYGKTTAHKSGGSTAGTSAYKSCCNTFEQ